MADGRKWATMNVGATDVTLPGMFTNMVEETSVFRSEWGEGWKMPSADDWRDLINNPLHVASTVYEEIDGEQVPVGVQVERLSQTGTYTVDRIFFPIVETEDGYRSGYYWIDGFFLLGEDMRANFVVVSQPPYDPFTLLEENHMSIDGKAFFRPIVKED